MTSESAFGARASCVRRASSAERVTRAGRLARLVLLAVCISGSVHVAHAGARLGPINLTRSSGTALEVPLGFTSSEAVTCAQFDLVYDPARVALGELATSTGASGHQIATSLVSEGRRRVVLFSNDFAPLEGGYIVRVPITWLVDGDSGLDVVAVTLASPAPAAVAFTSSSLTPAIASSAGGGGPVGGSQASLGVESIEGNGITYQWRFNGQDIAGATTASLAFRSAQHFHAGTYTVVVSVNGMVVTSESYNLTVNAPLPNDARLLNLSTRALGLAGDNLLIPGFVISGTGTKRMLVRGVGPGLFDTFQLGGALANPRMTLVSDGRVVASNDDWSASANKAAIASTSQTVGAFPLLDGSRDAAILVDLPAGAYTAPTLDAGGGTGIALVELYDADPGPSTAQLVNISNRGFVDVGDKIMIPGFVVSQEGPRTFLVRAVGPGLASTFGLAGVLADPVLTVFRDGDALFTVDDWQGVPGAATTTSTAQQVGAFPLENGSHDAAIVLTLEPGAYTVQATGKAGATGVALVEVYLVP